MSLTWVTGGSGGGGGRPASSGGEVLKTGYIKKTKTMKKKFFVLRAECGDHPSCLEYYDSEKKWKAHQPPKRVITLQSCFNINRRNDLKQRYVVALYTKDDCFCLALDSEEEAQQWLDALLETQRGEDAAEGERPKPAFEHVWQVQVQKKGLGSSRNILGSYMLCLTSHSLTLVRNGSVSTQQQATSAAATCTPSASEILSDSVEFSLNTIRRCGHSDCFFYMEVGRSSVTGAGELWMQTEDPNIAQNMHDSIFHAMMSCRNSSSVQKGERGASDADLAPHPRTRSSSANEATKPVSVLQRGSSARYVAQSSNQSQLNFNVPSPGSVSAPQSAGWRPIALPHHPSAQPQQLPSGHPQRLGWGGIVGGTPRHVLQQQHHHHHQGNNSAALAAAANSPSQRRHSVSGMGSRERCDSLPSSRARTISEGPPSSSLPSSHRPSPPSAAHSPSSNATHHAPHHPLHHVHPLHHHPLHHVHPPSSSSSVVVRGGHLVPGMGGHARPHSMYSRTAGLSYSPPIVSSPVSPASGACSTTDSAGSSLSMEEGEGWCGSNGGVTDGGEGGAYAPYGSRFGHSLTPDEPAIVEENADEEYMTWVPGGTGLDMDEEEGEGGGGDAEDEDEEEEGGERGGGDEVDGALRRPKRWRSKKSVHRAPTLRQSALPGDYVPMAAPDASARPPLVTAFPSPLHATPASASSPPPNFQPIYAATPGSLSLPLQPVSLGARPCQATSRASSSSSKGGPQLVKACTTSPPPPQQQQEDSSPYMEMHSPCGTSPPIHSSTDGYMPMSPVGGGGGGPLVADAVRGKQQDGYVPMTPGHPSDDGYVDMEPHQHKAHDGDGAYVVGTRGDMSPAASSCSVTSGTPSTDTRFSEYHLEKVSSYFTPSEEEEEEVGVGDDILPMERPVRAYSVGSKPETFRRKNCLPVPNNGTDIHKSPTSSSTLEVGVVEAVRVRAFSVGSRQCQGPSSSGGGSSSSPLHHSPHRHPAPHAKAQGTAHASPRGNALSPKGVAAAAAAPASSSAAAKRGSKSSSAPVLHALSNSWSGSSTLCSPPGSLLSPHPSQPSSRAVVVSGVGDPDHDLMELDFSGGASRGGQGKGGAEESPYVPMGVPPPGSTVVPGPRVLESSTPSSSSFSPPLLMSPLGPGAKAPSNASSASSSVTLEEEYVDMQCRAKKGGGGGGGSGGGDSYMEMFPVGRKSSLAAPEGHPGDYVNMEGRGGGKGEASRPIAIRKGREEGDKEQGGPRGGSSPNFSLAGLLSRKSSSGTPPKGPFSAVDSGSPFASLRRSRKKRVQEDEEEVGSEGGGASQGAPPGELATPTAIFPFSLNSPGSPVRPFPGHHYDSASKCPVDATSGSVHISYPPPSSFAPTTTTTASGTASTSHPPSRPKAADGRRRSEYSLPPAGGERGQEGKPFAPDYTNCGPAPRSESNYMPMAPCPGRVRKESVMSAPPNLTPATTSPSSSLFSSFSPSSKFSTQSSSDYVCMKAVRSPDSATRTCTPQRTKSSSADYMDIKLSSEPPTPASLTTAPGASGGSSKSDDYVEVDMSQQKHSSKQRPVVSSSVGAYVPSHTGFGFLPHIPSPSSRLPPTTPTSPSASYTWPRKGAQQEQARKAPVQVADHSSRDPKADDYVRMDLGKAPRLTSPLEGPPPSTTASVTATTTSLVTSPRPSLAPLVSLSSLPPAYKFALTSSSVGAKRATSSAAKSTTTTSTTSNSLVVSSSTSTPTVSISSTASLSSEAKVEALVSTLAPLSSAAIASGNLPPSIVSAPTPPPVDMAVAVCVTTSCSTPCVTSSLASSPPRVSAVECVPACPPSPPPSPLAVSGPIAIPTRASAAPQHALLPSAPPSSLFSATAPSPALCRVVTSCAERPKPDEDPQHQEHQPGAVEKKSSPAKVVTAKAPAAPAQHISSLARRVSSGKDPRSAGGNAKDGSPAAVADSSAKEGAKESAKEVVPPLKAQDGAEGIQDPVARQPPSRRGSRGCARRHSGDKESCETRSARPRRRSSDVSKSAAAQQQEVARAGGRGAMADTEDSSGSYEKLLLAPGSRGHQRKWGAHKSLGERAPSLGWGPLRRQMSSPSAVPDPDGAYEKLLPSNGGPVSRRRSGDKPGGLLPVDATAATSSGGYPPYSPVFSASSSSASSSSSLASVASTILLAPSAIKAANSTTASPTPPPTANATPGEIHYASLDLAPPTGAPTTASSINNNNNSQNDNDNERGGRRSPRVLGRPSSGAESPSGAGGEQPLNYAEIDFSKSMATSAAAKNQRVRH